MVRPGRPCTICSRPDLEDIERSLVRGEHGSIAGVAKAYGLSYHPLRRHRNNCMSQAVQAVARLRDMGTAAPADNDPPQVIDTQGEILREAHERVDQAPAHLVEATVERDASLAQRGIDIIGLIQITLERSLLLQDACHRYLLDPDDPSRYDIGPRAENVLIIHTPRSGKPRRDRLSVLLARAGVDQDDILMVESTFADPRKLILDSSTALRNNIASLRELLDVSRTARAQIVQSHDWALMRDTILDALRDAPEARERVSRALAALSRERQGDHDGDA